MLNCCSKTCISGRMIENLADELSSVKVFSSQNSTTAQDTDSNKALPAWRNSQSSGIKPAHSHEIHNVATTSLQRRCNVVTLQRRCKGVPSTLCVCWVGVPSPTTSHGKEHQQHSWHWEQNTQFPVEKLQRVHRPGKEGHVHSHCTPNKGVRFHSM